MANTNLLANQTYTIAAKPKRVHIQVNAALTGSIVVKDGAATIATITNPTVGSHYSFGQFLGICTIIPSTTCDATAWPSSTD